MKKIARLAGLALALSTLAGPAAADRLDPGPEAVDNVLTRIKNGDCAGAAKDLNEGLVANYAEVNLLAGSMFEKGVCLKQDWKKATHFYVKAYDGGQKAAVYRLAAGFAAPEHGPDMAAALWWASRERAMFGLSSSCTVSAGAMNDPDRFVAELNTWPKSRLATCNYIVGVMATLGGEIRYPDKAASLSLGGDFTLRFVPAVPRVDIKTAQTTEYARLGVLDGTALSDRESRRATGTFAEEIGQVAERALKRYPQPAGIPADLVNEMHFTFEMKIDLPIPR